MDVTGLTAILYSSHQMLALITKTQEFQLDESEAKMLGGAIAKVSEHYDGAVMSQQTLDWLNLGQVVAVVYGTRLMAMRMRKNAEKATRNQESANSGAPLGSFDLGVNGSGL